MGDAIFYLERRLLDAGIPIDGVSGPPDVRVDIRASATQAQRDQAAAIVAAFDWSLAAERQAEATAVANTRTIDQNAEAALTDLRAFVARTNSTITLAIMIPVVKLLCRVAIGLIRLRLAKLDAVD